MSEFKGFEDMHELDAVAPGAPLKGDDVGGIVLFSEPCPKCNGTGTWRGYSRFGRTCFKCKGKGKLEFKTSPEMRARGRKSAKKAKVKKAEKTSAEFDQWLIDECPDVGEWIRSNPGNSFATSLMMGGQKYGHLTEGQVAGVRKAIARDADSKAGAGEWISDHKAEHEWLVREATDGNEFAESLLNGKWGLMRRGFLSDNQVAAVRKSLAKDADGEGSSELDISSLKGYYAVPDGDTRLKLCVRVKGSNSRMEGWIFVDNGSAYVDRQTFGKQAPGGKYRGGVQAQLQAIMDDPRAAQVAYGKLTGVCGRCGKILEHPDSIAAGIGPICASK